MNFKISDFPVLSKEDYKPLYVQISDAIKAYIEKNNLKPGDSLPSESDLIGHFGVSRMTARIAIQRLATEGLVVKVQGKGTFVAEQRITGFIKGLRSLEQNLFDQGIEVTNELLEGKVFSNALVYWLKELGLTEQSPIFRIIRLKKINQNPIGVEVRHLPLDVSEYFLKEEIKNKPLIELLNSRSETVPHRVVYKTRSEILMEHYTELLQVPVGSPGIVQAATYYNIDDRPIMTGKLILLSEKVELQYEFRKQNNAWTNREVMKED